MSTDTLEVELAEGVVAFDGRVLEVFGFNYGDTIRLHVNLLNELELDSSELRIGAEPARFVFVPIDDEAKHGELRGLVERARSAAPNMEG